MLRNFASNKWSQSDTFVLKIFQNTFETKIFNISLKSWKSKENHYSEKLM